MSTQITLLAALFAFIKARNELIAIAAVPTGTQKKTAIVFEGNAINFLIAADNVGVALTPIEGGSTVDTQALSTPSAPPAEKASRKKAEKADAIPGPGSVPATTPATEVAKAMSVDDFRGYAQAAATKLGANGVDTVKALLDNTPIAKIDPKAYTAFKEKIDAAIAAKAAGLG